MGLDATAAVVRQLHERGIRPGFEHLPERGALLWVEGPAPLLRARWAFRVWRRRYRVSPTHLRGHRSLWAIRYGTGLPGVLFGGRRSAPELLSRRAGSHPDALQPNPEQSLGLLPLFRRARYRYRTGTPRVDSLRSQGTGRCMAAAAEPARANDVSTRPAFPDRFGLLR